MQGYTRSEERNEELVARLKSALDRFRRWGIEIPATSRFQIYLDRFEKLISRQFPLLPREEIHQLQFDLREIDEIALIAESFPAKIGSVAEERLRFMLSGSEHPDVEEDSKGRDAQWELYLRALFRRANIQAGLGNPDIVVRLRRRLVPVEAKRPKTEKRLDDRLRKGVSQIENSGRPGVIAISLDRAIREGRGVLIGPSLSAVEQRASELVHEMVARNVESIVGRVRGRPILGLIFHARVPAWVEPIERPQLITVNHVELISNEPYADEVLDRLLEGLAQA